MEECVRLLGMMVDQHCTTYHMAEDRYYLDSQGLYCNADAMQLLADKGILIIDRGEGKCVTGHWASPQGGDDAGD